VAAPARQRQLTATAGERRAAVALAVLAAIGFGLLQHDTLWLVAIGVGVAVVLAAGALTGHRALMAIGAFVCGFGPWGFAYIFGAPYLAFAGFLLWRANRLDTSE
jgi:hypothetical protein